MATVSRGTELDRLQRVLETQRVVNAGPPDAGRIIALVLERVQAALDADGAAIEFVEGDELVRQATSGLSRSTNSRTERVDASLSGQCVRRVMPLLCRDTRTDFRVDEDGYREAGIRSVAVAPIVRAGESVGVLEVLSARSDHFDHGDADVVELMANFVAPLHQGTSTLGLEAERALRDPLTGLANRLIFMDRLANQLSQSRRYGSPFGLFFVDLDDFSLINDSLGRDWGDAVLCAVAQGLSETVRGGDTLARLDGDRFAILCTNAEPSVVEHRLQRRIEAVIAAVNEELRMDQFVLRATLGAAWSSGEDTSPERLLADAGVAVSRAKGRPLGDSDSL